MLHQDKQTTGFIFGALLLILIAILLLIAKNENASTDDTDDVPWIVETNDPLVNRQLTERDFLPDDKPLVTFLDPQQGPDDASVMLVEFSDFQCPYCAQMQDTLRRVKSRFPQLLHVWKDAPSRSLHPQAFNAHVAARCAQDQDAFWPYHDLLFLNQHDLSDEQLENLAKEAGLNTRVWKKCYNNEDGRVRVERSITEAEVLGIDGTPFLFINDRRVSGTITYEQLEQFILQELAKNQ